MQIRCLTPRFKSFLYRGFRYLCIGASRYNQVLLRIKEY